MIPMTKKRKERQDSLHVQQKKGGGADEGL